MIREKYISACFGTWLHCETCIFMELNEPSDKKEILLTSMQCAEACFTLMFELACRPAHVPEAAKFCNEVCKTCLSLCEQETAPQLQKLAAACRNCMKVLRELTLPFSLN